MRSKNYSFGPGRGFLSKSIYSADAQSHFYPFARDVVYFVSPCRMDGDD